MAHHVSLTEARGLVAPPTGRVLVTHQDGMTSQIVAEVLAVSTESAGQTARLAERLRGASPLVSSENVFRFVRRNIGYRLDPSGEQLIKTPAAVIGTGYSDCKGYATLTNDLLRCLDIPSAFRFVSFSPVSTNVTHVYSVAWPTPGGAPVVLDACLPRFNQEKPYTHHQDHMTQISRVSGIGRVRNETPLRISGLETDEELTLKLMRQGAEVERNHAARVAGIGSAAVGGHQAAVTDYTEALQALRNGPLAVAGLRHKLNGRLKALQQTALPGQRSPAQQLHRAVKRKAPRWVQGVVPAPVPRFDPFNAYRAGREERRIGFLKKLLKKAGTAVKSAVKVVAKGAQAAGKAVVKTAKATGKVVAKGAKVVAKTAVKAGKVVLKVATLPARLLAKGLLEVFLPKMAPMFLYLFITNQSTIASLPPAAARKRRKAVSFARFITKTVGMKEAHFLKVVRTGIQRQLGGTPETVLAKSVKGPISGVGVVPLVAAAAKILPVVMEVLQKIFSVFGKKPAADESPAADDLPNLEADFADASAQTVRKLVVHAALKPASQRGEEPDTYANEMAQEARENATQAAVENEPLDTPVDAPLPEPEFTEPAESDEFTDYAESTDYTASDEPAEEGAESEETEIAGIGNYL